MRFWRFAIPIAIPKSIKDSVKSESFNNNKKDSTEIRKIIKDSEEFGIF